MRKYATHIIGLSSILIVVLFFVFLAGNVKAQDPAWVTEMKQQLIEYSAQHQNNDAQIEKLLQHNDTLRKRAEAVRTVLCSHDIQEFCPKAKPRP